MPPKPKPKPKKPKAKEASSEQTAEQIEALEKDAKIAELKALSGQILSEMKYVNVYQQVKVIDAFIQAPSPIIFSLLE